MMRLTVVHFILFFLLLMVAQCGVNHHYLFDEEISRITDEEIEAYLGTICLERGGHIGLTAIGRCGECGGMTPCCNMQICDACAAKRGVCPFCLKKVDWMQNTEPDREVPLLLAILAHKDDLKARRVAIHALTQIKYPGTIETMMRHAHERMLSQELAQAVGAFRDARYIRFLERVLGRAGDDYFGDEQDIETQYYLSYAAQAAAQSLVQIGERRAIDVLLKAAEKGTLWERCYAIGALGNAQDPRVKQVLMSCLREFFDKDSEWKWIPGRDLIGATLRSLAQVGDKETALLVIHYIRNPGCDFLYEDLKQCLSAVGRPAVTELIAAIREDLDSNLYDWGRQILLEALADIGDPGAIPFFIELITAHYPDQWSERDFKGLALQGLGKLNADEAFEYIAYELYHGKEESTRQTAAHALGQIGGHEAFTLLEEKLRTPDGQWVERECLASLNLIAFNELNTAEAKLTAARITAKKGGAESAFQLIYQSVSDGEAWGIAFFFDILDEVPLQRNFYNVVELLNTGNREVFDKTISFLCELTKLREEVTFEDSGQSKAEVAQRFHAWFQEHYQELR